ncbi:hypothetical protein Ga0074812_1753 [Parafrankia irregularis]|uniref:Uncharacterized protein n=2 Tax=Frankiaceae TaxID=74712 RepID=A0A0S4R0C6_9ACTN|nr:hypothetical protein Ga0074812_1753 [Parafrankia irregularis]
MAGLRRVDRQLWAVAGRYRRRRRIIVISLPGLLLLSMLALIVQAFQAAGDTRQAWLDAGAVCSLAAGGITWAIHTQRGQWLLDRMPVAAPSSRLAHHVLRLHSIMNDRDIDGWHRIRETMRTAAAIEQAVRQLHPSESTIPEIAGSDLAESSRHTARDAAHQLDAWLQSILAALKDQDADDRDEGGINEKGSGTGPAGPSSETMLALTRLTVLPPQHQLGE